MTSSLPAAGQLPERAPSNVARFLAILLIATGLFSWPLMLNHQPIYFNDTPNYLSSGRSVWATAAKLLPHAHGDANAPVATAPPKAESKAIGGRSPFYGAFIWGARGLGGPIWIAVAQALWMALAVLVALPRLGVRTVKGQLTAIAVLAGFSTLPFFCAIVMPDVFGGAAVLGLGILWVYWRRLGRAELLFWLATILAGTLFHRSFLMMAVVLAAMMVVASRLPLRDRLQRAVPLAALLVVSTLGSLAIDAAAARFSGHRVTPIPFLLARTIGDGTAGRVLREDCPRVHYVTCRYLPYLPLSEKLFLWDATATTAWVNLPLDVRTAVTAEQGAIVGAAVRRYPGEQLVRSTGNAVRQLFFSTVLGFAPNAKLDQILSVDPGLAADLAAYRTGRLTLENVSLDGVSSYWLVIYYIGLAVLAAALAGRRTILRGASPEIVAMLAVILGGLVANAMVNGVLAGVIGRYMSRLSWLAVLAMAVVAIHALAARKASD